MVACCFWPMVHGGVGMAIPDGSAHCCTCTREPTSITMHMGKKWGAERAMGAIISPLF